MSKIKTAAVAVGLAAIAASELTYRYYFSPQKEKSHGKEKTIICLGDSITFGSGVIGTRR